MTDRPIARCPANDVEAWGFPFYVALPDAMEPFFLYLEEHVYNFDPQEREAIGKRLVKISSEEDLSAQGFTRDEEGVWIVSD